MRINEDVDTSHCSSEVHVGLQIADQVFRDFGISQGARITSLYRPGDDKLHGRDGICNAFDNRLYTRMWYEEHGLHWDATTAKAVRESLHTPDFDDTVRDTLLAEMPRHWQVVLERHQTNPHYWHFHCEFDRK